LVACWPRRVFVLAVGVFRCLFFFVVIRSAAGFRFSFAKLRQREFCKYHRVLALFLIISSDFSDTLS
ncbi:MAG: hypothetical protein IK120_01915, partial [Muribaculaceae bacterium]|nr:hypothetical protein [Muribaculaceae bacterium]